jgi:F420-non-reducing hydrogenase iron-sulfur subunit
MTVKRITFLQELLSLLGLEGRLGLSWISSAEAQKFVQVVTDFTEKIRSLGPNPLSAFSNSRKAAAAELMQLDIKGDGYDQQSQSMA